MSTLSDPDDARRDTDAMSAEQAAAAWVEFQQRQAALDAAAQETVDTVREYLVAIAAARLMGDGEVELTVALDSYIRDVLDGDEGPRVIVTALYDAVWNGGQAVERTARTQLMRLRDVATVADMGGGAS